MRTVSTTLSLLLLAATCFGQGNTLTDAQRAELRKRADEARERNAREREEIQKGFAVPNPTAAQSQRPSDKQLCRAAIGALMGRAPASISVTGVHQGVIHTKYTRQSDRTVWENRCRVAGEVLQWATLTGVWRTRPGDELITFILAPAREVVIKISHSDGSFGLHPYAISDLGDA